MGDGILGMNPGNECDRTIADEEMESMERRLALVKAQPGGTIVACPVCGAFFKKRGASHSFCSNSRTKGKKDCKTKFWNKFKYLTY